VPDAVVEAAVDGIVEERLVRRGGPPAADDRELARRPLRGEDARDRERLSGSRLDRLRELRTQLDQLGLVALVLLAPIDGSGGPQTFVEEGLGCRLVVIVVLPRRGRDRSPDDDKGEDADESGFPVAHGLSP
jgi:hypothetical protein